MAGIRRKSAAGEYGKQANFFFSRQQPKTDRRANLSRHKSKVGGKRKTAAGKIQPEAAKERPTGGLRQANKAVTEIRQAKNDLRRVKDG